MRQLLALAFLLSCHGIISAQNNKPRVYIFDSQSWEITGGIGGGGNVTGGGFGGAAAGGARPQTAEIIKTFGERCKTCVVTMHKDKADYMVLLEHEGGKDLISRDNKFVVYNEDGDVIESGSTRSLGNAVKDACESLLSDWDSRRSESTTSRSRSNRQIRERVTEDENW